MFHLAVLIPFVGFLVPASVQAEVNILEYCVLQICFLLSNFESQNLSVPKV